MNNPVRYCISLVGATLLTLLSAPLPAADPVNQLRNHASPYLALHGSDPVAWQDWRPAAIQRARRDNKLLFVSIGYFSCHWCHVMQRESYRNPEIARYLNDHFVAVKVDRELEPALDARMIAFVEASQGVGGWPLNVFLTPDGHPLYAVLYMPPREFLAVLTRLQGLWQQDPAALKRLAREATGGGKGPGTPVLSPATVKAYTRKVIEAALARADPFNGGFGEQSKFPSAPQLDFLLRQYKQQPDPELKELLTRSLDHMMQYGLYDHLGGGFFRYTVDPGWRTPHFEKMLYDNALMARLYSRAGRLWRRPDYRRVARETLAFMESELRRSGGGFIASLSAIDSNNVEGGYYFWHPNALAEFLKTEELVLFRFARGMTDAPPFEHGYLPIQAHDTKEVAARFRISPAEAGQRLAAIDAKVLAARSRRNLPADTKVLAGWNGLTLSAYAEAARRENSARYREIAQGVRDYLVTKLWHRDGLYRSVADHKAIGQASLEDYAQVTRGLLDFARLTGAAEDYRLARQVVDSAWQQFYRADGWRLSKASLIQAEAGQDVIADGPMVSPTGSLLASTVELADATGDKALRHRALAALNSGHAQIAADPFWHVGHIGAMELAIAGR